jgi:hypothetical protein
MGIYEADPTIKNTIFEGNFGTGAVYFYSSPLSLISYCDFFNNEGGDFIDPVQGLGVIADINANGDSCDIFMNIFMDPLFYAVSGDSAFYLTEDSPCIDAGDPASPPDPDTTVVDIGRYYYDQTPPSAVEPLVSEHPYQFQLFPNYPNPFNPSTVLRYNLVQPGSISLTVHNILGQTVSTLYHGRQQAGNHTVTWDASDVSSGIYFARLNNGVQTRCTKMILLK